MIVRLCCTIIYNLLHIDLFDCVFILCVSCCRSPAWLQHLRAVDANHDDRLQSSFQHFRTSFTNPHTLNAKNTISSRRPFLEYANFMSYTLYLTHVEQEEQIRYLKYEIEMLMMKCMQHEIEEKGVELLKKYGRKIMSTNNDFTSKLPVLQQCLIQLTPYKKSLGQLLESVHEQQHQVSHSNIERLLSTNTHHTHEQQQQQPQTLSSAFHTGHSEHNYIIIGETELYKALNNYARNIIYFMERDYLSLLIPCLLTNHNLNQSLFFYERCNSNLLQQMALQDTQLLTLKDLNMMEVYSQPYIQEYHNSYQQLLEIKNFIRISKERKIHSIKQEYNSAIQQLKLKLKHIKKQFKINQDMMESLISNNMRQVRDDIMVAFLDGEFTQRSLFALFNKRRNEEITQQQQQQYTHTQHHSTTTFQHQSNTSTTATSTSTNTQHIPLVLNQTDDFESILNAPGLSSLLHTPSEYDVAKRHSDELKLHVLQMKQLYNQHSHHSTHQHHIKMQQIQNVVNGLGELQEQFVQQKKKEQVNL